MGMLWRMTACKQKPNMVIAMVTYPCFIQPEDNEETWLDNFFFKRKKYLSLLAVRLLRSGERSMIKIYRHWHAAITQRHCRILSRSGFPPCSLPLRLATGLLLVRVRLFIRLCNCTQSGRWWLMCEIITRSSVDGMRALRSRTSPIWLSLVYILILAPAWPLRLRVNLEDAIK